MPVRVGTYSEDFLILESAGIQAIGDLVAAGNGTRLDIVDGSSFASIRDTPGAMLSLDRVNGLYQIGDIDGVGNGTKLQIDDANTAIQLMGNVGIGVVPTVLFQVQSGGIDLLSIDPTSGTFLVSSFNSTGNGNTGSVFSESISTQALSRLESNFNDGGKVANIELFADATTSAIVSLADTHTFIGDSFLHRSGTALDDGAAAAAGTLLNAPAAGNPTKWVPIDDNGIIRYIPAW